MQGVDPATVVGRYINECWNRGRIDLVDELVSAEFIDHLPFDREWPDGIESIKTLIASCRQGFSDFHLDVGDMIAEDDRVVVRCTALGRHDGCFYGVDATQRHIRFAAISIYRVENHQIIDQWGMIDRTHLLQQLGIGEPAPVLHH